MFLSVSALRQPDTVHALLLHLLRELNKLTVASSGSKKSVDSVRGDHDEERNGNRGGMDSFLRECAMFKVFRTELGTTIETSIQAIQTSI